MSILFDYAYGKYNVGNDDKVLTKKELEDSRAEIIKNAANRPFTNDEKLMLNVENKMPTKFDDLDIDKNGKLDLKEIKLIDTDDEQLSKLVDKIDQYLGMETNMETKMNTLKGQLQGLKVDIEKETNTEAKNILIEKQKEVLGTLKGLLGIMVFDQDDADKIATVVEVVDFDNYRLKESTKESDIDALKVENNIKEKLKKAFNSDGNKMKRLNVEILTTYNSLELKNEDPIISELSVTIIQQKMSKMGYSFGDPVK